MNRHKINRLLQKITCLKIKSAASQNDVLREIPLRPKMEKVSVPSARVGVNESLNLRIQSLRHSIGMTFHKVIQGLILMLLCSRGKVVKLLNILIANLLIPLPQLRFSFFGATDLDVAPSPKSTDQLAGFFDFRKLSENDSCSFFLRFTPSFLKTKKQVAAFG